MDLNDYRTEIDQIDEELLAFVLEAVARAS